LSQLNTLSSVSFIVIIIPIKVVYVLEIYHLTTIKNPLKNGTMSDPFWYICHIFKKYAFKGSTDDRNFIPNFVNIHCIHK